MDGDGSEHDLQLMLLHGNDLAGDMRALRQDGFAVQFDRRSEAGGKRITLVILAAGKCLAHRSRDRRALRQSDSLGWLRRLRRLCHLGGGSDRLGGSGLRSGSLCRVVGSLVSGLIRAARHDHEDHYYRSETEITPELGISLKTDHFHTSCRGTGWVGGGWPGRPHHQIT